MIGCGVALYFIYKWSHAQSDSEFYRSEMNNLLFENQNQSSLISNYYETLIRNSKSSEYLIKINNELSGTLEAQNRLCGQAVERIQDLLLRNEQLANLANAQSIDLRSLSLVNERLERQLLELQDYSRLSGVDIPSVITSTAERSALDVLIEIGNQCPA